jgi:hypothetical protein
MTKTMADHPTHGRVKQNRRLNTLKRVSGGSGAILISYLNGCLLEKYKDCQQGNQMGSKGYR